MHTILARINFLPFALLLLGADHLTITLLCRETCSNHFILTVLLTVLRTSFSQWLIFLASTVSPLTDACGFNWCLCQYELLGQDVENITQVAEKALTMSKKVKRWLKARGKGLVCVYVLMILLLLAACYATYCANGGSECKKLSR